MPEARVDEKPIEDRQARFERLYREHVDRLWRSVLLYSGDPELASDAVSEAFVQAIARGDAVRDPAGWVWKATFRIAAGLLKERRRQEPMTTEPAYEMADPLPPVVDALAQLSTKQRGAVVLHHYVGYPVKDVARILGSTAAAVGVHLHRGRRRLRELLEERDD